MKENTTLRSALAPPPCVINSYSDSSVKVPVTDPAQPLVINGSPTPLKQGNRVMALE